MKKKLIIFAILAVAIITTFLSYYFIKLTKTEKLKESLKQEVVPSIPSDYCLITYQISKDGAKTWQKVTINDGKTPIEKNLCWEKYLQLLKNFKTNVNNDNKWYGKNSDGQLITKPVMKFSDKPFAKVKSTKKLSKNESTSSINE